MSEAPRCIRPGRDLTLVLRGGVQQRCLEAAQALARLGIEAELIELPGLAPPPGPSLVLDSLRRTGRLACVTEAGPAAAAGAALAAWAAERGSAALVRPVLRIVLPAEALPLQHLVQPLLQLVAGPRARDMPGS